MTKYKIKSSDFEKIGEIAKYDKDNFKKSEVMATFHKETAGIPLTEKRELLKTFFNRNP